MILSEILEDAKEKASALKTRADVRRIITKRKDRGDRLSNQLDEASEIIYLLVKIIEQEIK